MGGGGNRGYIFSLYRTPYPYTTQFASIPYLACDTGEAYQILAISITCLITITMHITLHITITSIPTILGAYDGEHTQKS